MTTEPSEKVPTPMTMTMTMAMTVTVTVTVKMPMTMTVKMTVTVPMTATTETSQQDRRTAHGESLSSHLTLREHRTVAVSARGLHDDSAAELSDAFAVQLCGSNGVWIRRLRAHAFFIGALMPFCAAKPHQHFEWDIYSNPRGSSPSPSPSP